MLLALCGVGVLQASRSATGLQPTLLGDLLVFSSGTAFAVFAVMGKQLTARHGGLTVNTFAFLGGGLCLVPVIVWQLVGFDVSQVTGYGWLSLAYMAIFPSALAYLIFYWALTHVPASRISNFTYLQPVMATLLAVLLLGDSVTGALVAGGSLVLTGVFVSERG
jgi:drug/metabolite transporter (DMT)-like permease